MAASEEVRRAIRLARQTAGMTQMEVARRMKISHSKLSLFESGLGDLESRDLVLLQKIINSGLSKAGRSYEDRFEYALESAAMKDGMPERKRLRLKADLSQSELSNRSQIPQSRISLWETGQVELTKDELARWGGAIRAGMERAILQGAIIEREMLKVEKQEIAGLSMELIKRQKEQIERLNKHLSNVEQAYQIEIRRLKKENAELRAQAKKKRGVKSNG
jgi:transcriptional regulator with XRE-family HTH domain